MTEEIKQQETNEANSSSEMEQWYRKKMQEEKQKEKLEAVKKEYFADDYRKALWNDGGLGEVFESKTHKLDDADFVQLAIEKAELNLKKKMDESKQGNQQTQNQTENQFKRVEGEMQNPSNFKENSGETVDLSSVKTKQECMKKAKELNVCNSTVMLASIFGK